MSEHVTAAPSPWAFHYRGFVLYWFSRFLNAVSIQIVSVAVGWQIYDQTRDPFLLASWASCSSCPRCRSWW